MGDKKLITVTGLWANVSKKNGTTYLSGSFGMARVYVFPSTKKKDTDPDYTLCIGERPEKQATATQPAPLAKTALPQGHGV